MISPKTQELIDKYPEIIEQNLKKWLSVALFELKLKESHKEVIAAFVEFYEQKKGVKYRFNGGKDGNATKAIILGIRHQWNQTHGEEPTKENILVAFRWMLDNLPPWVFDNLSLSVFNSQFNQIVSYGKSKSQPKQSTSEALEILNSRHKG